MSQPDTSFYTRIKGRLMGSLGTVTLLLGISITATAYGPFLPAATGVIQQGDTVVLNQAVTSAAGARLYLQDGQVVARGRLKHREPYCYFFLRRESALIDTAFDLSPDRFEITSLWRGIEYGMQHAPLIRYATFPFNTQDASAENMIIRLELRSSDQPGVMALKCGIFAVPNERNHLSLGEVQQALGEVVTLELQSN